MAVATASSVFSPTLGDLRNGPITIKQYTLTLVGKSLILTTKSYKKEFFLKASELNREDLDRILRIFENKANKHSEHHTSQKVDAAKNRKVTNSTESAPPSVAKPFDPMVRVFRSGL
jgi:hypothetical protein